MTNELVTIAYIAAAVLFILSLGGLANQETARRGNLYGVLGMLLALLATAARADFNGYGVLAAAAIPAAIIGAILASRVQMTSMPQLVAILHSFVGAAAVLVGFATYLHEGGAGDGLVGEVVAKAKALTDEEHAVHLVETLLGVCIGSLTFTGSIIAWGKLQGVITSKPLMLPARHFLNVLLVLGMAYLGFRFFDAPAGEGGMWLLWATVVAGVLGVHLVMAIGGADMPVVVSMLNSYSGWAASAAGFMLSNDLLIITGALVGSSGAILSFIMCRGMNRSFVSVILGGFGAEGGSVPGGSSAAVGGEVRSIDAAGTADLLRTVKKVVIVPGYGMAVAQAQHSLAEITKLLRERGVTVKFAIHPVAGRLPGHMNVLLAEANVPYDIVEEMEEIGPHLPEYDLALVIGANDIVNPSALDDPSSPIAGMPVLEVWKCGKSIVMKRGMASGYAGVDNPLFYRENNLMLFGDAKKNVDAILAAIR